MLCPLIQVKCVEHKCAWYDNGNQCCAVLGLLIERVKATEAVMDASGGGSKAHVTVNPVVQIKEIIKTIPILEVKHDSATSLPDKTSQPLPTVTWFKPSEEGDQAGVGAAHNAGIEPEDVGDNSERDDSNWSQDIPGQDFAIPTDVHGPSEPGSSSAVYEPGNEHRSGNGEDASQL